MYGDERDTLSNEYSYDETLIKTHMKCIVMKRTQYQMNTHMMKHSQIHT